MTIPDGKRDYIGMAQSQYPRLYGAKKDARAISSYDMGKLFGQRVLSHDHRAPVKVVDWGHCPQMTQGPLRVGNCRSLLRERTFESERDLIATCQLER